MSVSVDMSEQDQLQTIAVKIMMILEDAHEHAAWIQNPDSSLSNISSSFEAIQKHIDETQGLLVEANKVFERI